MTPTEDFWTLTGVALVLFAILSGLALLMWAMSQIGKEKHIWVISKYTRLQLDTKKSELK